MLWPNLNSPGVLCKKLDRVKDCVILWIIKFLGLPRGGKDEWEEGWEYISVDLTLTYVDAKFDLARWLVEKVGQR